MGDSLEQNYEEVPAADSGAEDDDAAAEPPARAAHKRQRDGAPAAGAAAAAAAGAAAVPSAKRKRLEALKEKKKSLVAADKKKAVAPAPSELAVEALAPWFWQALRAGLAAQGTQLTALESAAAVPAKAFFVPAPRRGLAPDLLAAVRAVWPSTDALTSPALPAGPRGSPLVLAVVPSASRAHEVCDVMHTLRPKTKVLKLISKHITVDVQRNLLKGDVRMVTGTPGRLLTLLDDGALSADRVALVALDLSRDVKGFHLLSLPETRGPLCLLFYRYLLDRARSAAARVTVL